MSEFEQPDKPVGYDAAIRELFGRAVELPADRRARFLQRVCADAAVRTRVLSLLAVLEGQVEDFLEYPVGTLPGKTPDS